MNSPSVDINFIPIPTIGIPFVGDCDCMKYRHMLTEGILLMTSDGLFITTSEGQHIELSK